MPQPIEQELADISRKIAELQSDADFLHSELISAKQRAARESARLKHLRFLTWLRAPAMAYNLWPLGVILIGPSVVGAFVMICVLAASGSWATTLWLMAVAMIGSACVLATYLWSPSDSTLTQTLLRTERELELASADLADANGRYAAIYDRLQKHKQRQTEIVASDQLKRANLLERNWKAMRGAEWEDFLIEV